jgi:ribosomal protein L7/L12
LYLDEVKALDQFNAKFGSGRPEQLAKENRFFDSIITSTQVKKALKLKFLRNITGDDMKEAFNVSIGERLKKFAKGEAEMKEGSKALESFKSQFTGQKLAKGSTITFYFDEGRHQITCDEAGEVVI